MVQQELETENHHVALCSGGKDSIVATHASMVFGPCEEVVFLDTRTGPENEHSAIDDTISWLSEWCESNGWRFTVSRPPVGFEEIVSEHGFPGPSRHFLLYRRLKDRAISAHNSSINADCHYWTGIRRHESENRMQVAEPDGERGSGRWYWHSPIVNFTDERKEDYIRRFNLRPVPAAESVGRSVDCWCGCFGDPNELIDLEVAGYPEHADWLRNLETPDDVPKRHQQWAGYNYDKSDWAEKDDLQTTLCGSCGK